MSMKKKTYSNESGFSSLMGAVGASTVIGAGLALGCPLFALLGALCWFARKESAKEIGKQMDDEEMADTEKIAEVAQSEGLNGISITRNRECGGFLPLEVERTHVYYNTSYLRSDLADKREEIIPKKIYDFIKDFNNKFEKYSYDNLFGDDSNKANEENL